MSKVVVIGGGASGIVAAISAAQNNNEVIILERNSECLKKLLITGNGRCNYFNEDFNPNHYYSKNSEGVEKIITLKNKNKVLNFFSKIGIVPQIKNGYYYPHSLQAISIKNALLCEVKQKKIKTIQNCFIEKITKNNDKFIIECPDHKIEADKLIIAAGSSAYPKTGSDGNGYSILKSFGHTIHKVLPALTGLTSKENNFKSISGVRSDVTLSLYENKNLIKKEKGQVQFTDFGISGICTFNLSIPAIKGLNQGKSETIKINFMDFLTENEDELITWINNQDKNVSNRTVSELLEGILNYKIVNFILKQTRINNKEKWTELDNNKKKDLVKNLLNFEVKITSYNSFENSQSCQGGIALSEINHKTMESLLVKNLYITGELLDICGECGGYNLGFAFLSGILAGEDIHD